MSKTIVFGDIHGCYDEFLALLTQIGVTKEDTIISVGDIVDRGPKSVEVYDYFRTRKNAKVLMGNHERKHLRGILSYSQEIVKVQFGERYHEFVDWTKTLDYYYETDDAIIVHAFFEHDQSLPKQRNDVLAGTTSGSRYLQEKYGENQYWQQFYQGNKPIIYGHHVVGDMPKITHNTYGIDTGACHGGRLTAIELPSFKIHQIQVETDYWAKERVKWQIPVLEAKSWSTMTFEQINRQIQKLRYVDPDRNRDDVQTFLNQKQEWSHNCQALLPLLHQQLYQETNDLLQTHGQQSFNFIASQYPYKVFLFKARKNRLEFDDLKKSLNTPEKVFGLKEQLGI